MRRSTHIWVAGAMFIAACGDKAEPAEESVEEGRAAGDCRDGADNDGDGDFDCDDPGCDGSPDCESDPDQGDDSDDAGDGADGTDGDDGTDGTDPTDLDGDGVSTDDGDCNDDDATIYPGAADDVGDGIDQNCDGVDGVDADGDGFASEASGGADCDDSSALTFPDATDLHGDGIDLDCDGVDGVDGDGDGYASAESGGGDCDDGDALVNPAAVESDCNGRDDDCNGSIDDGADCPVPPEYLSDSSCASNDHAYLLVGYRSADRLDWTDAETQCSSLGYELMKVDDECEWEWFEARATERANSSTASRDWWTGLRCTSGDCTSPSDFTWLDGTAGYVEWLGTSLSSGFPCARIDLTGSDTAGYRLYSLGVACDLEKQYVCEAAP